MSEARAEQRSSPDLEALLSAALRPVDPPAALIDRVEGRLSAIAEIAAGELTSWADDVSEAELAALRDPRNWVRPVVAATAGGVAAGALVLIELRRRRRPTGLRAFASERIGGAPLTRR